jgi:hypothetical protein
LLLVGSSTSRNRNLLVGFLVSASDTTTVRNVGSRTVEKMAIRTALLVVEATGDFKGIAVGVVCALFLALVQIEFIHIFPCLGKAASGAAVEQEWEVGGCDFVTTSVGDATAIIIPCITVAVDITIAQLNTGVP